MGDFVFSTSLVLWVATVLARGKPWAPVAVSGVILAMGSAVLFVGPVAGVFVDRWNPIRTMLNTEVIRGSLVVLLMLVSFLPSDVLPVWIWLALVYLVVFGLNATGQFFGPSRFSIIQHIVVGEVDRARAAGIAQATAGVAAILGPPLAAPLLFSIGLQWALLFNATSYALSFVAIRSVGRDLDIERKPSSGLRLDFRADFMAGLRFFAGNRFLLTLLAVAMIGQCGMGALNALNVFFLSRNLHAPAHLYGYLGTAMGVGGIVGALFAGRVVRRVGARATAWISLVVGGVLLIGYSRATTYAGGLAVLFLFMVPITMLNTAMAPLLLSSARKEYTGRVIAVFYPGTQLSSMLAALTAGWLASSVMPNFSRSLAGARFGPIDSVFAVSGMLILLAGVLARFTLCEPAAETESAAPPTDAAQAIA